MGHCSDLAAIISPILVERFVATCWEKKSLHVRRGMPGYFGSLFSTEELDRLINLSFTNYGIFIVEGQYVVTPRLRRPRKTSIYELFREFSGGKTLAVREMHVRRKSIGQLVSAFALQSGFPVAADLLAAPPGSCNAGIFSDSRSLFVLQLDGAATWRVPSGMFQPFAEPQDRDGAQPETTGSHVCVPLQPGDTLYLAHRNAPAGSTMHAALPVVETGGAHSLHLVLTVHRITWADLLVRAVVVNSVKNIDLRRALDFGAPLRLSDADRMEARFRQLLKEVFARPDWRAASHLLACEHMRRLPVLPDGHFEQIRHVDDVDGETVVKKRPGIEGRVQLFDGLVELLIPGHFYHGPDKLFLALDFVSEAGPFKVKDIPGWYTDQERIIIVKHLLARGILTFATSSGATRSSQAT